MAFDTYQIGQTGALATGTLPEAVDFDHNGTLDKVLVTATTAPTTAAVVDVLANGTSVYAAAAGTLVGVDGFGQAGASSGISATDTRCTVAISGTAAQPGILPGAVLLIDTEQLTVVGSERGSNIQGASGTIQSGLTASTGFNVNLTVQRGSNGTVATAHTGGTSVFPARPTLAANATTTGTVPGLAAPVQLTPGTTLTVAVLSGAGAQNIQVLLETTAN